MPEDSQAQSADWPENQPEDSRLSPAEAHSMIRQLLERLAAPWRLEPEDVYLLGQQMQRYAYAPGETILPFGVRADFLGLVVRGQVGAYADHRITARQVAVLMPGSTFGDPLVTENRPSSASLRALSRCEVRFLHRADLEATAQERQRQRGLARLGRTMTWSVAVLLICLAAILALSLPAVRQAAGLVPMALGQWCSERAYDRCTTVAWSLAADMAPADASPHLALGAFYLERGDLDAARRHLEFAQALAPDLAEIHNNLGLIYARQGDHAQAIAAFGRSLELEPGVAAVEHNLGLSYHAIGAYGEALARFELALALGQPHPGTLVNMAVSYFEAGQTDKAANAARQALAYNDASAPAHAVLGAVALGAGNPQEALLHLQRALEVDAGYTTAYYYLGLAHEALGQMAEAIAAFEQALAGADQEEVRSQIRSHLKNLYGGQGAP